MTPTQNKHSRFFYGYIIVIASFVILLAAFGVNYSFGIFFTPLLDEFGWSRAVTSTGYSIITLVSGVVSIFAGKLSDKTGPRVPGLICGISMGTGLLAMSQAQEVWQFYVLFGGLIGISIGCAFTPYLSTISRWFVRRRGLMTGILSAGTGFGTIVMPLLSNALIDSFQWRQAYAILGVITIVIIVAAALFLKRSPDEMGLYPDGEEPPPEYSVNLPEQSLTLGHAMRSRHLWIIALIFLIVGMSQHTIVVHIVPHAMAEGISTSMAAMLMSVIGAGSIAGRIGMGSISDRIGTGNSIIVSLLILTLSLLWLQVAHDLWGFLLFALVFGFSYGGMIALEALAVVHIFGLSSLGMLVGIINFSYTIGGSIGPALAGYIFDVSQAYTTSFWLCSGLLLAVILVFLSVRRDFRSKSSTGTN